ncbi:MAG: TIGR00730 family Rossman fold protein [Ruminococcaceae bacterium]|nr:TIGR00730 family Rossman fold protein [Oscillospiraceae bacterium]
MNICVYGAASDTINECFKDAAFRLGKVIAETGNTLVFGAGTTGIMGACVRGVDAAGGTSLGIAPKFFDTPGVLHPNCTEMIFTETMRERKELLEEKSDMFIMAPGGIGTLDEFFENITLRSLGRHGKKIAILNTNGFFDALLAFLKNGVEMGFIGEEVLSMCAVIREPEELKNLL